jgi:putative ABC transport system permease protein
MLSAYSVLTREVSRNYLGTHPASAQIITDNVDATVVAMARRQPGVAEAEASSVLRATVITTGGQLRPLLLFVIPDMHSWHISTARLDSGAWPIADGSVVLERTALGVAEATVGQALRIEWPDGRRRAVQVVGTVHDPALAPAWQEQTVYGYVTAATAASLTGRADLQILELIVSQPTADARSIEDTAKGVAQWLTRTGHVVQEIRVPPPRLHPHQAQMTTVLALLLAFSLLGLGLGSVLGATVIRSLLAQHSRDIAIMKAIGARTAQISALYLTLVVFVALTATMIGTGFGLAAGRAWVTAVAQLLNLRIDSYAVSWWMLTANALVSVLVPFGAGIVPVLVACRRTVRDAIDDLGVSRAASTTGWVSRGLSRFRILGPATALGLRNAFRRRARLALSVLLIAVAGGVFIASASLRTAWNANIAAAELARHYDLEIAFQTPVSEPAIVRALAPLSGIRATESWPGSATHLDPGDHLDVSRTYPDEGHGRITLRAVPPTTPLVTWSLTAGRWLNADDTDSVVINSTAQAQAFPHTAVGDTVDLLVRHHPRRFRVVGMVREVMTPGALYTTPAAFRGDDFPVGFTNGVRIAVADKSQVDALVQQATAALGHAGMPVSSVITEKMMRAAQGGHVYILVYALGFIAVTMAVVGVLGMASMLSTSVTERIREFGILRAIGARAADIRRVVLIEALVAGALGATLAVPLSLPLSAIVGRIIGRISLQPLVLSLAATPMAIWLALAILGSIAAGFYPSVRASRLTVRQTLTLS